MIGLTPQENTLLEFIGEEIQFSGVAPSVDEMTQAIGLKSKSGAWRILNQLERKGRIRRMANRFRAIEVVKASDPEAEFIAFHRDVARLYRLKSPPIALRNCHLHGLRIPLANNSPASISAASARTGVSAAGGGSYSGARS